MRTVNVIQPDKKKERVLARKMLSLLETRTRK